MAQLPIGSTRVPTTGEDQQRALATQVACGCIATCSLDALLRGHEGAREFCRQYTDSPGAIGACCLAMLFGVRRPGKDQDQAREEIEAWCNLREWPYQQVLRLIFDHATEGGCFYCQHEQPFAGGDIVVWINEFWYDNLRRLEAQNVRGTGEVETQSPVELPREPVFFVRRVGLKRGFKRQ